MSAGTQQVPIPWTPAAPQLVMAYSVWKGITRSESQEFLLWISGSSAQETGSAVRGLCIHAAL